MLFSELFGSYYRTVSHILQRAVEGTLDKRTLSRIVQEEAFGESLMTIPDGLLGGRWGLLTADCQTPLSTVPPLPLTTLEKRWLKALLLDPRIQLFQPDLTGLEDVRPLFRPEWLVYYDRYTDGDPYDDPQYQANFRCILTALQEKRQLEVAFTDGRENPHNIPISPQHLEYSEKDDRFRLIGESYRPFVVNLSRITHCALLDEAAYCSGSCDRHTETLTLELTDRRQALERVLLHFSHLEKETKQLDEERYRIILHYDPQDETELLIRVLSFGAVVEVVEPDSFRDKLRERIEKQLALCSGDTTA